MIGVQVSRKGFEADTPNPRELAFSSEYFMHNIGKTEFVKTTTTEQKVSHTFGYIPILFSYSEDVNNAGSWLWAGFRDLTGADISRIQLAFGSGKKIRYYALYQGI